MKALRIVSAIALLLVAGCAQVVHPLNQKSGARLTVTATSPQRSLIPSFSGVTYDLTLAASGQTTVTQLGSSTTTFTVTALPDATWTAQIDARMNGVVIASGTASRNLGPGDSDTLLVPLTFDAGLTTGTGGVSLSIDASAAPSGAAAAAWILKDPSGATTAPTGSGSFSALTEILLLGYTGMVAGPWTLDVTFFADSQKTLPVAQLHETVLVLNGYTTYPTLVLPASSFTAPGTPELVSIPGGTFVYGSAQATVSSFLMGKYSVTQAQFQAVMGFNPSYFNNSNSGANANPEATWSPVEQVSMWDAMEYCNRLSRASGLEPIYTLSGISKAGNTITAATVVTDLTRNGYRLPTDAEWEYAARAGTTTTYIWGASSDSGGVYSWTTNSTLPSGGTTRGVGQKNPNALGLYDLFGNVFQFTNDWFGAIPGGILSDYAGPVSQTAGVYSKITRGSAWNDSYAATQNAVATRFTAGSAFANNTGFRVARRTSAVVQTLAVPSSGLYDGVGELRLVRAATDGAGGWIVSGGTGLYTGAANTGTRRMLLSRILASGVPSATFGGSGTVLPLSDPYTQGSAAGFSQDPTTHTITIQAPWYDAGGVRYGEGDGHTRISILFQYDSTGAPVTSANFPPNGGVQEDHFFTDVDDGFDNSSQYYRNKFPVRDSAGNLYSIGHRPETGADQTGIQKLFPDGTVNKSFWTASSNGNTNFVDQTLAIFPNGTANLNKVLIGGLYPTVAGLLVRLNTNGTEDATFGSSGRVTFDDDVLSNVNAIRIDSSDRIYVAGLRHPTFGQVASRGVVARLLANGTLDSSFGTGGLLVLPDPFNVPRDLAIDTFGRIVVVGETKYDHSTAGFALRVLANGSGLDTSFGVGGYQLLSNVYGGSARSVDIDGAGKIGVAGFANNSDFVPQSLGGYTTTGSTRTTPAFWVFEGDKTLSTITYVLNGGVPTGSDPAQYYVSTPTITFTTPSRPGYVFGGWYSDAGLTTPKPSIPTGSSGAVTVYAKWTAIVVVANRIAAGGYQSLSIKADGTLWPFGYNYWGVYGNGTATTSNVPVQVGVAAYSAVAAGEHHSLLVKADGTLMTSGRNWYGQLGNGATTGGTPNLTPFTVLTGVAAVAAGVEHSLALKTTGDLYAFGWNSSGQLGDTTLVDKTSPVLVMTGVKAIAAGSYHSLVLKTNGDLYTFGYNLYGQLGDNSTVNKSTPTLVMTGVSAIAAGWYHSLVLKTNGTLWAFGQNTYGQLGDGTTTQRNAPVQILSAVSASTIAAGLGHSLVLKDNGTLLSFGQNDYGQLGNGTTSGASANATPYTVLTGVIQISAGKTHSLALKSDGTLMSFGDNVNGNQLGDGTAVSKSSPVAVSGSGW